MKGSRHLLGRKGLRFEFIDDHRAKSPVTRMCKVPNVSASGYHAVRLSPRPETSSSSVETLGPKAHAEAGRKRPLSPREMANRELVERTEAVYQDRYGTYGSPRIYRGLKARGAPSSEN